MGKELKNSSISSELLAAYLDGNTTSAENKMILENIQSDPELREILEISQGVDAALGIMAEDVEILPMMAMAASCKEENYCALECEKYILKRRNISFDENEFLQNAIRNKWQKEEGTALYNIGRNLEEFKLSVRRKYKCSLADIVAALEKGDDVMAVVDGGELLGNSVAELAEDILIGQIPDHTVVVISYNAVDESITLFDPNSSNPSNTYPVAKFIDAWADSKNYLVTVNTPKTGEYIPHPVDLSDVVLTEDLHELREAIAENAHEVWAASRQAEGWTYGPMRNDQLKQTPDMVPYSDLLESEKEYDRKMAMDTIKLLKKLGYDLVKR